MDAAFLLTMTPNIFTKMQPSRSHIATLFSGLLSGALRKSRIVEVHDSRNLQTAFWRSSQMQLATYKMFINIVGRRLNIKLTHCVISSVRD